MGWGRITDQKCIGICDIFTHLESAGVTLPEEKTALELMEGSDQDILAFAERLHKNDELWGRAPATIRIAPGINQAKKILRIWLGELLDECRDKDEKKV